MIPLLELKGEGEITLLSLFGVTRFETGVLDRAAPRDSSRPNGPVRVHAELFCLHALPRAKEPLFVDGQRVKLLTLLEQPRLGLICFSPLELEFLNVPKPRKTKKAGVHL